MLLATAWGVAVVHVNRYPALDNPWLNAPNTMLLIAYSSSCGASQKLMNNNLMLPLSCKPMLDLATLL
jgi:hypothetical protein